MDKEKVFRKDSSARPTDYILDRVKALDGVAVEEALKMAFKDSKGKLKKYKKKDLDYIVGKWLVVEIEKSSRHTYAGNNNDSEAELHCAATHLLANHRPMMLQGMLNAATELDHTGKGHHRLVPTLLYLSTTALHVACHAAQPHRRANADAEMHAAFEGTLEGGTFDADRMHFGHSLLCQGFAAAV